MKKETKLSRKIASVVAGSLTVLGGMGYVVNAQNDSVKNEVLNSVDFPSNKEEKPQLVLSMSEANNDLNEQFSHGSHSSHGSHGSHSSHASHGSSSI